MNSDARTPTGVAVVAVTADGAHNVTEAVQALYDHVIESLDWGSGFLSIEDVEPIVELAKLCGFKRYEEAEQYMAARQKELEQQICEHGDVESEGVVMNSGYTYTQVTCQKCGYVWGEDYDPPPLPKMPLGATPLKPEEGK